MKKTTGIHVKARRVVRPSKRITKRTPKASPKVKLTRVQRLQIKVEALKTSSRARLTAVKGKAALRANRARIKITELKADLKFMKGAYRTAMKANKVNSRFSNKRFRAIERAILILNKTR